MFDMKFIAGAGALKNTFRSYSYMELLRAAGFYNTA